MNGEISTNCATNFTDTNYEEIIEREMNMINETINEYKEIVGKMKDGDYKPTPYCKSKGILDEAYIRSSLTIFDNYEMVEKTLTTVYNKVVSEHPNIMFDVENFQLHYQYIVGFKENSFEIQK